MRINFYTNHDYWGGLANNGGSRTILKSAEELRKHGNAVEIVAQSDKFTWFKHPKCIKTVPANLDLLIAVSITDVIPMIKERNGAERIAYWSRPVEWWRISKEERIKTLEYLIKNNGKLICNSGWETEYWENHGIKAETVFAGLDFDEWEDKKQRKNEKPTIGFLVHKAKMKRFDRITEFVDILGDSCRYLAFGETTTVNADIRKWLKRHKNTVKFYERPNHEKLVEVYNCCDWFLATSDFEGFNNPPTEAALCGCAILCSDDPRNGCHDYCIPETACIYKTVEEAAEYVRKGVYLDKIENMKERLLTHIGLREWNMMHLETLLYD